MWERLGPDVRGRRLASGGLTIEPLPAGDAQRARRPFGRGSSGSRRSEKLKSPSSSSRRRRRRGDDRGLLGLGLGVPPARGDDRGLFGLGLGPPPPGRDDRGLLRLGLASAPARDDRRLLGLSLGPLPSRRCRPATGGPQLGRGLRPARRVVRRGRLRPRLGLGPVAPASRPVAARDLGPGAGPATGSAVITCPASVPRTPLARTTAAPIAVVRGTASTSPMEPTRVRISSPANCSVCST